MQYKIIVFVVTCLVLIISAQKIWQLDMKDRSHPYGLDMKRNEKYPHLTGERNGVSVYWGKPSIDDTLPDRLNKIEWLSNSYEREVCWRRALVFSLLLSPLLLLTMGIEHIDIKYVICFIPLLFVGFYFYTSYYEHHIGYYRSKYIKTHIRKLKKNMKVSLENPIYEIL